MSNQVVLGGSSSGNLIVLSIVIGLERGGPCEALPVGADRVSPFFLMTLPPILNNKRPGFDGSEATTGTGIPCSDRCRLRLLWNDIALDNVLGKKNPNLPRGMLRP